MGCVPCLCLPLLQVVQVKMVLDALHSASGLWAAINTDQIVLLGDGFSSSNGTTADSSSLAVPLDLAQPHSVEPLGANVSLLAAVFDQRVHAVAACNGLVSFRSVLEHQCVHIPHDVVVPKALVAGDLPLLGAAIVASKRTLIVSGLRDGLNRLVSSDDVSADWRGATHAQLTDGDDAWQMLLGTLGVRGGKL